MVFHVLNRGVGRMRLFLRDADFEAFERMIVKTLETRPMRILAFCLMPNHWHLVLWPERDGDLGAFMQKLTITHARNWQEHRRRVGYGHLYQGRYKSFPVESDEHFYQVVRYVQRNALRANLARRAEDWRWGSLWRETHGTAEQRAMLSAWPIPRPATWAKYVHQPQNSAELESLRRSLQRGQPYGSTAWVQATVKRLGLQATIRPRGRPKKP
ncbi:MAG TPA: transposase [Pirellulales bacterium]|jgi:putative transposase|nr:transposase [Pirellulales bacterium]